MKLLDIFNPDIAFDGWAIGIIIFILGLGGTYVYLTRNKIQQKQKAGSHARQRQKIKSSSLKDENIISQKQKAGDNADQSQTM